MVGGLVVVGIVNVLFLILVICWCSSVILCLSCVICFCSVVGCGDMVVCVGVWFCVVLVVFGVLGGFVYCVLVCLFMYKISDVSFRLINVLKNVLMMFFDRFLSNRFMILNI